jgi:hypothetical protein
LDELTINGDEVEITGVNRVTRWYTDGRREIYEYTWT